MTDVNADIQPKRGPGRPPKMNATREPSRDGSRDRVILGRDGEVLKRKMTSVADPYHVPEELKEPGWTYQWNTVSVVGNTEVVAHQQSMMIANGWRAVPANRPGFKERFGMEDDKRNPSNCIIIGGMRLDERPAQLTEEAQTAEYRAAVEQTRDRDSALTGGKANLRASLEAQSIPVNKSGYQGRKTQVSIDIDPDAPRPSYQYGTEE
jgi:hypothetical protein